MLHLGEALLVVLYLMKGKITTQFEWNLRVFLVSMWCSKEVPMRAYKFVATPYGAWCYKIKKEIQYLEENNYISNWLSAVEYCPEIDMMINNTFFEKAITYNITEKGEKHVKHIAKVYKFDLENPRLKTKLYLTDTMDIPYIIHILKIQFPKLVKRKK